MSVETMTAGEARLERVLAAIFDPERATSTDETREMEPDEMTDRQADREFGADADFEAARLYG